MDVQAFYGSGSGRAGCAPWNRTVACPEFDKDDQPLARKAEDHSRALDLRIGAILEADARVISLGKNLFGVGFGMSSLIEVGGLESWLLWRAEKVGAAIAISDLMRFLDTGLARAVEILAVSGVEVESMKSNLRPKLAKKSEWSRLTVFAIRQQKIRWICDRCSEIYFQKRGDYRRRFNTVRTRLQLPR